MNNAAISELYQKLEMISDFDIFDFNNFPSIDFESKEISFAYCVEFNSLYGLNESNISKVFDGNRNEALSYLEDRIVQTKNDILIAKYYHFIYILTKNNKYSSKAIDNYLLLLTNSNFGPTNDEHVHSFVLILKIIIELTEVTKYNIHKIKNLIIGFLEDNLVVNRVKYRILQTIKETNLFKQPDILNFPSLCIELAKTENDSHLISIALNLGLHFALKLPEKQVLIRDFYELLGDNEHNNIRPYDGKEENIMIPHYNQNAYEAMMIYYQKAKNAEKYEKAASLYNQNKRNLKLIKITSRIEHKEGDKILESLSIHFNSIVNSSLDLIIFDLCLGDKLLFMPNAKLEEFANGQASNFVYQCFTPKLIDINNNSRGLDVKDHSKFQFYGISIQTTLSFVIDILLKSVSQKKMSFTKVLKVLNDRTFFGHELIINSINNMEISYTWSSQIDIALKSFFDQCNFLLKGKKVDWRISTDILSLKFEGILRDIIALTSGCIVKIDKDGNTSDMVLDDLLRSEAFSKVFDDDDRNLFYYTFTNKGLNIRNCVAHSFFKPQHYTMDKAVLVLLCVLRLAKYFPNEEQKTPAANK